MNIIAKMRVELVEDQPICQQKVVSCSAVYDDDGNENKSFAKVTPSANFKMWISYETPACNFFKEGEEVYLTFSKVI